MTAGQRGYVGRFAPSPTGPLHAGSLVAALASWLDARAHHGRWLVRIEDVDTPRCIAGAGEHILHQLALCGLHPDAPPLWQSQRGSAYDTALRQLSEAQLAYPCGCSRKEIAALHAQAGHQRERHADLPYPGTCRHGLSDRVARAWRLNVERTAQEIEEKKALPCVSIDFSAIKSIASTTLTWHDRRLGLQQQDVATAVGDFVLRRADGLWAYQLAVVVDDAHEGITHIVRGEDLADNTPRQMLLQLALGVPVPCYLHTPLVMGADGEKLSKQNGAQALDLKDPLAALTQAAQALGLPPVAHSHNISMGEALATWEKAWAALYNVGP